MAEPTGSTRPIAPKRLLKFAGHELSTLPGNADVACFDIGCNHCRLPDGSHWESCGYLRFAGLIGSKEAVAALFAAYAPGSHARPPLVACGFTMDAVDLTIARPMLHEVKTVAASPDGGTLVLIGVTFIDLGPLEG